MEYTAFYRKYRPKCFSDVIGQDHIIKTIKNQILADRVGHAYLFTGCRGSGKTSTAKILSRAVNCLNPVNGEPCNECEICKANLEGSLTDVVEMDAASNNGVDHIRAIRDEVTFLPTLAKYRVYIIDEVHMLSTGAFNALLKTLEEPPKHVKFILATTEPQKLPATILSRCQRFDFKKISNENLKICLKNVCDDNQIKYSDEALNLISELSEGAVRDALSILERCVQEGNDSITEEGIKELVGIPKKEFIANIVKEIVNKDSETLLVLLEKIINEGKDLNNLLWEMIKYMKDLMLLKVAGNISNTYNEEDKKFMLELLQKIQKEEILQIIYDLSKLEKDVKESSQKSIVFEVGILRITQKEAGDLEERVAKLEDGLKSGKIMASFPMQGQGQAALRGGYANNAMPQGNVSTNPVKTVEKTKQIKAKSTNFWDNVKVELKENKMVNLYANLNNTKAVQIDDMTIGIQFENGLNSFTKAVIEKPENMQELRRLVSIECQKDMAIKLIENDVKVDIEDTENKLNDLGIKFNIIEE